MVTHFFKIAFRSLWRHKSAFAINAISLTAGLTCALLIFLWAWDEWQVDKFHEKGDRLYQVMHHSRYPDHVTTSTYTPGPLAAALRDNLPEVEHATTLVHWFDNFILSSREATLTAKGYYAENSFFELFSFDLIAGNRSQLLETINNVVITRSTAEYFFGTADRALGQTLELNREDKLVITGVCEDIPKQSSLQFDFVLPVEKFTANARNEWMKSWGSIGPSTFLTLKKNTNPEDVDQKVNALYAAHLEEEDLESPLFLKPFSENYLYGKYENGVLAGGRIEYIRLFILIGLFILLIACINFMNLATARGARRAREVGIRKTVGAGKKSLVAQFLLESVCLSVLSFFAAIVLLQLLLPAFNNLADKDISLFRTPSSLLLFGGVILFTGLLAGSYPAFYLSSFKPVEVFKGILKTEAGELWVRRGLVVFQFAVSVILIVSVLVILEQMEYIRQKNLGFDKDQLVEMIMDVKDREKIAAFLQEAKRLNGVVNISCGHTPVDHKNQTDGVSWEGKEPDDQVAFGLFSAHDGLVETMGFNLKAGRAFSRDFGEEHRKVILNESAVKATGYEDPVGKRITLWEDVELEIIGVVEDFHFRSFYEEIQPLLIRWMRHPSPQITARLERGKEQAALQGLEQLYARFNPGVPFHFQFLDQQVNDLYRAEQRIGVLSKVFAGLAVLISCLGLLGLVVFTIHTRRKEIGIRKVLGAGAAGIVRLLTSDLLKLVGIAILLAIPVAWWALDKWLSKYAYRIDMPWWVFVLAALMAISIAAMTVGVQSVRAALANPVEALRDE